VQTYAVWASGGAIALICAIFLLRGRVRIERGWAGWTLQRFSRRERTCHWLLALSLIALALTGPVAAYGRHAVLALVGGDALPEIVSWARWLHEHVAFAFTAALGWAFLLWVRHSLPSWRDLVWLAKGGGLLVPGVHPPAWKFNTAQKLLFWSVMLAGLLLSLSGFALLFPNARGSIATALAVATALGAYIGLAPALPAEPGPQQAIDYATLCHGAAALGLLGAVIVHIYLRTLIIEGALSAMMSGEVDANWARQHHRLWAEREIAQIEATLEPGDLPTEATARGAPAE
jgi:formate dehydrogenase subunit gamma